MPHVWGMEVKGHLSSSPSHPLIVFDYDVQDPSRVVQQVGLIETIEEDGRLKLDQG